MLAPLLRRHALPSAVIACLGGMCSQPVISDDRFGPFHTHIFHVGSINTAIRAWNQWIGWNS
jgi:hypothetical protein